MEIREKIALYRKLLSDPYLTEAQREVIAKLLAGEKAKGESAKSHSFHSLQELTRVIHRQIN
jgi:hypothetical protein